MHDDEVDIDEALVQRLLARQMPAFAGLPLTVVEPLGTDHAIWRLGDDHVVRLPRIGRAAGQAELEATWLPRLAPHLPVAVPEPVGAAVNQACAALPYYQGTYPLIVERSRHELAVLGVGPAWA
jgi:aminoglycoside phosphotransferase (APT) family kinase protein